MSEAADRKNDLRVALETIFRAAARIDSSTDVYDDPMSWPIAITDAIIKSESAGDAKAQDRLIEAIGTVLGLGVDESLKIPEAADRLAGERARGFIISTLHGFQTSAEAKVAELKTQREADPDPDGRLDLMAQSRHHQGVIEAIGYAIELVNISALPGDNDQAIAELITASEARMLVDLFEGIPEEVFQALYHTDSELPAFVKRMRKLANTPPKETP